jgi:hypothetical protein
MEQDKTESLRERSVRLAGKFFSEAAEDTGVRLVLNFLQRGKAILETRKPLFADVVMDMPEEKHEEILEWAQTLSEEQVAALDAMPLARLKKLLGMEREARIRMINLRSLSKRTHEHAETSSEGLLTQLYTWGHEKFGKSSQQEKS